METLMPKQSDSFLYQNSSYYGQVKPENLLFNSNLQEFSQKANWEQEKRLHSQSIL